MTTKTKKSKKIKNSDYQEAKSHLNTVKKSYDHDRGKHHKTKQNLTQLYIEQDRLLKTIEDAELLEAAQASLVFDSVRDFNEAKLTLSETLEFLIED